MGQIVRCPLTGDPCVKPITLEEHSFFLAEAGKPEDERILRREVLSTVLVREHKYMIRSALDEGDVNAFTCKICKMIQVCAYGIADITRNNHNVLLELGMMIALGKPTIILKKKGQKQKLKLPSDIIDRDVIPFADYTEIMPKLRKMVENLPPPVSPPNPIQDLEKIQPKFAEELRKIRADIVKQFKESMKEAKIDTISLGEEKKEVSPQLNKRLRRLEKKLEDMARLGFATDAETAASRAYYFFNRGEYEEAIASLNWALELSPDDPVTLSNRGATYSNLKRYDEALADFNRALELKPDYLEALYNRGLTYYKLERYDEALDDFNRALELKPDSLEALCNRGFIYAELKRYDEALADYNRALQLKPDDAGTLYNLACIFALWGKPKESIAYLKKAIALDSKCREDAKTDTDFNNIRDDPRFKKLIESD